MCSYSAFLLSYAPFFCGVKIVFFPLFITVSRYYDMYTQGGVTCIRRAVLHVYAGRCYMYTQGGVTCIRRAVLHIRPLRTPKGVPFLPVSAPFLTLTSLVRLVAKRNSPSQKPCFRSDSPCLFMLSK